MPRIQASEPPMLQAALLYAAKGYKVLPCLPWPKKEPLNSHAWLSATADASQLREEWRKHPEAGALGLAMLSNGLIAIDADVKNDINGEQNLRRLTQEQTGQEDLPGLAQRTPSGGMHHLFRVPDGLRVKQAKDWPCRGCEIKSTGYILLDPSPNYHLLNENGLDALTDLPDWLLASLPIEGDKPAVQPSNGALPAETSVAQSLTNHYIGMIGRDTRNNLCFKLAQQLRDTAHLTRQQAEPYIRQFQQAAPKGDHSFTLKEALNTLASAYKREPREPAQRPEPPEPVLAVRPRTILSINDLVQDDPDHAGHADCVLRLYPDTFLYGDDVGWMVWTGKYWHHKGNTAGSVMRAIETTLKKRRHAASDLEDDALFKACRKSAGNVSGVLTMLKARFSGDAAVSILQFNTDPDLINVNNGVLDLRTGQLTPHDRTQRFTYCLPTDYDPQADQSMWLAFLRDSLDGNDEAIRFLQLAMGYTLTGHAREKCFLYLHGRPDAGKGVFTDTMRALLGPLYGALNFDSLTTNRMGTGGADFDMAMLYACRMVVSAEGPENQPLNAAKIKAITGLSDVRTSFKGKDTFEYAPRWKLWLASNHVVVVDADEDGFWSRLRVVNFPKSYTGHADTHLKERLASNLPGVLAWAVQGAVAYHQGGLPMPACVRAWSEGMRDSRDTISQFVEDRLSTDPNGHVLIEQMRLDYETYCLRHGIKAKLAHSFNDAMRRRGHEAKQKWHNGRNVRAFWGITLKEN